MGIALLWFWMEANDAVNSRLFSCNVLGRSILDARLLGRIWHSRSNATKAFRMGVSSSLDAALAQFG